MALWQFVVDLIPAAAANIQGVAAARMTREQLDVISLNFSSSEMETLFGRLETLLPEKRSWSSDLRIWGDEKTDDVQVGFEGQTIEDVQFRVNVSDLSLPLVSGICGVARQFNCVFATRDGAIVQPSAEAVVRAITQSRAMQFVRDPQRYLEEAILLDGKES